jgi:hypothetical protein
VVNLPSSINLPLGEDLVPLTINFVVAWPNLFINLAYHVDFHYSIDKFFEKIEHLFSFLFKA